MLRSILLTILNLLFKIHQFLKLYLQAPKFHTLVIMIYRYRNSDLAVTTAKIAQKVLETTTN